MFVGITFPFFGGLLGFFGGFAFAPTTYFVSQNFLTMNHLLFLFFLPKISVVEPENRTISKVFPLKNYNTCFLVTLLISFCFLRFPVLYGLRFTNQKGLAYLGGLTG